jgi:hypothetical protein
MFVNDYSAVREEQELYLPPEEGCGGAYKQFLLKKKGRGGGPALETTKKNLCYSFLAGQIFNVFALHHHYRQTCCAPNR